jgi:hypothetical protein
MRGRIQKATNRLREHLLGDGQGNSMKTPRKHILVVESDDNSVVMLQSSQAVRIGGAEADHQTFDAGTLARGVGAGAG